LLQREGEAPLLLLRGSTSACLAEETRSIQDRSRQRQTHAGEGRQVRSYLPNHGARGSGWHSVSSISVRWRSSSGPCRLSLASLASRSRAGPRSISLSGTCPVFRSTLI